MAARTLLFLCAQGLLAQTVFSQCFGPNAAYPAGLAAPYGIGPAGWAYDGLAATDFGFPGNAWGYDGAFAAPYGAYVPGCGAIGPVLGVAPASGGGLPISSTSPIAPAGLMVRSDNAIEGILAVTGQLPFVSAVALEGALPTAGAGSIAYGCGDGSIGIVSDLGIVGNAYRGAEFTYPGGFPAARAYDNYLAPRAPCGCGGIY